MPRHLCLVSLLALGLAACGGDKEEPAPVREEDVPAQPAEPEPEPAPIKDTTEAPDTQTPLPTPEDGVLSAEGWPPLAIGMTREEVTMAVGGPRDPNAVGGPEPETCDYFRAERTAKDMLVMLVDGELERISLAGEATLKTADGFGIGDDAAAIKAAHPDANIQPHKYVDAPAEYITVWMTGDTGEPYVQDKSARGIRYEIGENGTVTTIHAGGPAIQYIEGCL